MKGENETEVRKPSLCRQGKRKTKKKKGRIKNGKRDAKAKKQRETEGRKAY